MAARAADRPGALAKARLEKQPAPRARVGWAPGAVRSGPGEGCGRGPAAAAAAWAIVSAAGLHRSPPSGALLWRRLGGRQLRGGLAAASGPTALSASGLWGGAVSCAERSCFYFLCSPPPPSLVTEPLGIGAGVLVHTGSIPFVSPLNQTYFSGTANLRFGAFSRQGGGVLITIAV